MSDTIPFETRTLEQLPPATSVSPDALMAVQEPGGPVQKLKLRQLLGRLISTAGTYELQAQLFADLDYDATAITLVYGDPDPAKRGWYHKIGGVGAGSWNLFERFSDAIVADIVALKTVIEGLVADANLETVAGNIGAIISLAAAVADVTALAPYTAEIASAGTLVRTAHPFDYMEGHEGAELDTVWVAGAGLDQHVTQALTTDGRTFLDLNPDAPAVPVIRGLIHEETDATIDYATDVAERARMLGEHGVEQRIGFPKADYYVDSARGSDLWGGEALQWPKKSFAGLVQGLPFEGVREVVGSAAGAAMIDGAYWGNFSGGSEIEPPQFRYYVEGGVVNGSVTTKNRLVSPGKYQRGSATPTVALAGSGTGTPAAATANFGPAFQPGDTIGLMDGGYWRETLYPRCANLNIVNIPKPGQTRVPILDGADVIPPANFTASAHVDAGGVVYETSCVIDTANGGTSHNNGQAFTIWQNNSPADPGALNFAYYTYVASVAACAALPGSYYYPTTGGTLPGNGSTPITVYVHPLGSVNPSTPGVVTLETQKRYSALEFTRTGGARIEGVAVVRPFGNNGFNAGRDTILRRVLLGHGTAHNAVVKSGLAEDCILWDGDVQGEVARGGGGSHTAFVYYTEDASGLSGEWRRVMAIGPRADQRLHSPFLAHTSSPTEYELIKYGGCIVKNAAGFSGTIGTLRQHIVGNTLFAGGDTWGLLSNKAREVLFTENIAEFDATQTGTAIVIDGFLNGGADIERLVMENNAFNQRAPSTGQLVSVSQAVPLPCRNNVFVSRRTIGAVAMTQPIPAGGQYKDNITICAFANAGPWQRGLTAHPTSGARIDYNVYIQLDGSNPLWFFRTDTNANVTTLAAWKALGLDLNSVVLTEAQGNDLFLTGVAGAMAGDYRLNPYCDLRFSDGTPIVSRAGIRKFYDHNLRRIMPGQPWRLPRVPTSIAECHAFLTNPLAWDYYA
jgi:hypothetical protein